MVSGLGGWRGQSCTTGDAFTETKRVSMHARRILRAAGMEMGMGDAMTGYRRRCTPLSC